MSLCLERILKLAKFHLHPAQVTERGTFAHPVPNFFPERDRLLILLGGFGECGCRLFGPSQECQPEKFLRFKRLTFFFAGRMFLDPSDGEFPGAIEGLIGLHVHHVIARFARNEDEIYLVFSEVRQVFSCKRISVRVETYTCDRWGVGSDFKLSIFPSGQGHSVEKITSRNYGGLEGRPKNESRSRFLGFCFGFINVRRRRIRLLSKAHRNEQAQKDNRNGRAEFDSHKECQCCDL